MMQGMTKYAVECTELGNVMPGQVRTTISLHPETNALLSVYRERVQKSSGRRPHTSEAIEDALRLALPVMLERTLYVEESREESLMKRAARLKARILNEHITEAEVLSLMSEASLLQADCRTVFLVEGKAVSKTVIDTYMRCSRAAIEAYNAGASRLNEGNVVRVLE